MCSSAFFLSIEGTIVVTELFPQKPNPSTEAETDGDALKPTQAQTLARDAVIGALVGFVISLLPEKHGLHLFNTMTKHLLAAVFGMFLSVITTIWHDLND